MEQLLGEVKVYGHGRVQLPKPVRTSLDVEDGDKVWWLRDDDGKIYVEKYVERASSKTRSSSPRV